MKMAYLRKDIYVLVQLSKVVIIALSLLFLTTDLIAQSGGWDSNASNGTTGYTDHGNGVIQLLNTSASGCAAAAVHETTATYDPTSGTTFSQCYQVFFGCPGNDNIGGPDANGDGMAFSFSKCGYNINNGNACGGGLGYMGACSQMITVEFDTWSSQGNSGFDGAYGGGTSGNHDEVAIHRDGNAQDAGRITSADAGNLEDGLEHTVCITYVPATHIMTITIDGNTVLSYNFTGSPYDLPTYFGAGGLNQTWSSGKFGANNPATVSNGASISANVGGPLCPANIVITSPSNGASFTGCSVGPITISASATPPAGNTASYVEFFVDGISIGTDNSSPYSTVWNSPADGNHALTAVAHYTPSNTTSTSAATNISVGGGIKLTTTAPAIDGTIDAVWGNYITNPLTKIPVGSISGAADLSATYQTMRDATNLYILVNINDDVVRFDGGNPWDDDGVEVFIDMGNDKNTSYGANDFQYAFVWNSGITEYKHNATSGVTFGQASKAGGYIIEIKIPWTTLGGAPNNGDLIGFDVHVNDDDDGGGRDSKIAWNDAIDIAFNNPSGFGTVTAAACDPCPTGVLSGSNSICNDGITTGTLSVSFTGTGPWTFTYSIDGVTQPAISGINSSPYTFQSATGAHSYALVSVSNPFTTGCSGNATGSATISVITIPTGTLSGDNSICNDGISTSPISVSFTGGGPWAFTYSIDGVTQPAVSGIATSPYVFQSATGAHTYALVSVTNAPTSSCAGSVSGTATITMKNVPTGHNDTFIAPGTATLSVDNTGGTYEWYDAPVGGNLVFTGPVFTTPVLTDTTTYYVQEASGAPCRIKVKAFAETIPVFPGTFFIPNLITPNSDGKNDLFEITALPGGSVLEVYNRWGDRVYQSSDYDNLWAGNNTSDGVYYYDLVLPDGKQYKGWLNIVR
jgi:gliding motility-associated-like protein